MKYDGLDACSIFNNVSLQDFINVVGGDCMFYENKTLNDIKCECIIKYKGEFEVVEKILNNSGECTSEDAIDNRCYIYSNYYNIWCEYYSIFGYNDSGRYNDNGSLYNQDLRRINNIEGFQIDNIIKPYIGNISMHKLFEIVRYELDTNINVKYGLDRKYFIEKYNINNSEHSKSHRYYINLLLSIINEVNNRYKKEWIKMFSKLVMYNKFIMIYNEVRYRPGHSGYGESLEDFKSCLKL